MSSIKSVGVSARAKRALSVAAVAGIAGFGLATAAQAASVMGAEAPLSATAMRSRNCSTLVSTNRT